MMHLLVLAAGFQAANPAEVPIRVGEPILRYMTCLFEPVESRLSRGVPSSIADREAIVTSIIEQCRDVRARSAAEAEAAFARSSGFSDPANRIRAVEGFLSGFEDRLRFTINENERFREEADAYEACLASGRSEC